MIECAITGCALVLGTEWVAGDLFDAGDCWVFNGNTEVRDGKYGNRNTVPEWRPINRKAAEDDGCCYPKRLYPTDWWEKRGVFVIKKSQANLNQAAKDYIDG